MANKTEAQKLQEELTWSAPHIAKEAPEQKEQAYKYCEGYKEFLNTGKTERECVKEAVRMLKEAGYRLFDRSETYAPGDKVDRKSTRLNSSHGYRSRMPSSA